MVNEITIPDKNTGDTFSAAEENQYLDAVKDGTKSVYTETIKLSSQTSDPTYDEGRIWYNSIQNRLKFWTSSATRPISIGREVVIEFINNSAVNYVAGDVLYTSGLDLGTGLPEAELVDTCKYEQTRLYAVALEDVNIGQTGYATTLGSATGIDTSVWSVGDIVYVDPNNAGKLTNVKPIDECFSSMVGVVLFSHATAGVVGVAIRPAGMTEEVTSTNGFPPSQRTDTTISFVDGTRTFTIAPTGADFHYYQKSFKYIKTASENVVITDVTGIHAIYYDEETLTALANPTLDQFQDIVINKVFVATIYWNSTAGASTIVGDERHGISMSPYVHSWAHRVMGTQYEDGLGISNIVIGNGSSNTHAQFGTEAGEIIDEDIDISLEAVTSTTGLEIFYRSGTNGAWVTTTNAGYSLTTGGAGLMQYNQFTGSTWQLTEATSGNYVYMHVYATNDINWKPVAITGIAQYSTLAAAEAAFGDEINAINPVFGAAEYIPIASILFQTKSSFTNAVKSAIVQVDGNDYVDWRTTKLTPSGGTGDHGSLGGLGDDDHNQYLLTNGSRLLTGDQSFNANNADDIMLATFDAEYNNGDSGTSITIDWNNGNFQHVTLTDNATITFTAPATGGVCRLQLRIVQDSTGGRAVSLPSMRWAGGALPTLSSTANSEDIITIMYNGSSYYAVASVGFATP